MLDVAPARANAQQPLCVLHRCRTLGADASMRVFQATQRHLGREGPFQSTYARWLPTGRVTKLGDYVGESILPLISLKAFVISGEHLAYALDGGGGQYGFTSDSWTISRLRPRTGRRFSVCADPDAPEACESYEAGRGPSLPGVTDIVVTPAGSVAWITSGSELATSSTYSVYELAANSTKPIQLASTSSIEPKSLAAVAGHLYWTQTEGPRSAPIA